MEIFSKAGFDGALLIAHVVVAMMWMGLLWFFNFVQTPAYAEMDGAARNNAFDKITWRALWWFRWAAVATVVFGLLVLAVGGSDKFDGDFWKSTAGVTLLIGILFGLTMLYNVWMVIWPAQKIVIGNARNVQAGGEADPAAAPAARRAGLASRQNTIYSFAMLMFMVGTAHFFGVIGNWAHPSGSDRGIYWAIAGVVWLVLELNALGVIGGTGQNFTNWMYESHRNALIAGGVLVLIYYFTYYLVFKG